MAHVLSRPPLALLSLLALLLAGCAPVRLVPVPVPAMNEVTLAAGLADAAPGYRLERRRGERRVGMRWRPKALVLVIPGAGTSGPLAAAPRHEAWIDLGYEVHVVGRRGVDADGTVRDERRARDTTRFERLLDAEAALEGALAELPEDLGPVRFPVLVIGHGDGGAVAASVAARNPMVSHVVLLATGGSWTPREELRWRLVRGEALAEAEADALLDAIEDDLPETEIVLGRTVRAWRSVLDASVHRDLVAADAEILVVHGDADGRTPVASARQLVERFAIRGRRNLAYREYDGMGHDLRDTGDDDDRWPEIRDDLVDWLRATGTWISP